MPKISLKDAMTEAAIALIDIGHGRAVRKKLPNGWVIGIGKVGGGALYRVKLTAHDDAGQGFDFGVQYKTRTRTLRVARKFVSRVFADAASLLS